MGIYQRIKRIFTKNTKVINIKNEIIFTIDQDQVINLQLNFNHYTKESAEKLALLLFFMNEGYYVQSLLDSLFAFAKDNNQHQFVQQTISAWSAHLKSADQYEDNNSNDNPIIKPTQFSSLK